MKAYTRETLTFAKGKASARAVHAAASEESPPQLQFNALSPSAVCRWAEVLRAICIREFGRKFTVCAAVRAVSDPEGPAVSDLEGPAVSDLEGPAVSDPEVPAVSDPEGPAVSDPEGPAVLDPEGPAVSGPAVSDPAVSGAIWGEGRTTHREIYNTEDAFSA